MRNLLFYFLISAIGNAFGQGTISWSSAVNVAPNLFGNNHPRISADASGNPVVSWGHGINKEVLFSKWNGTSFTTPVVINPAAIPVFTASWAGPDMIMRSDTIYIVYKHIPEDTNHIYLTSSFDGGLSFSVPSRVDNIGDSASRFPTVAIDPTGNPVVAFMKFNSTFGDARWVVTRSSDFGLTFSTDVLASGWSGGAVCDCCPGSLVSDGSNFALLYRDNLNNIRDNYVALSGNGGALFTAGWPIDQSNWMLMMCPSSGPDGILIGDSLYSVFMSGASGMSKVYLSTSSLSSALSNPAIPLTGSVSGLSSQNYPRIAQAGNAVAIVWKQHVNSADQLVIRFTNDISNGLSVQPDTIDLNNITNADVCMTNGNIFVVWQDDNSGTVKYRKGTFNPASNDVPDFISTDGGLVYPNPSSDLWITETFTGQDLSEAELMNSMGKLIKIPVHNQNKRLIISNNQLPPGIYFLRIKFVSGMRYLKMVKN